MDSTGLKVRCIIDPSRALLLACRWVRTHGSHPIDLRPQLLFPTPANRERTNEVWAGRSIGFYFVVVDAMLRTGFMADEIGKIGGGNFLRVFGATIANSY